MNRLRSAAHRAWRVITAFPRALLGLAAEAWARRTYLRELKARDPVAGAAAERILEVLPHEPLVKRYKLVDAQGKALEVNGMPGHVALFVSYAKAVRARRKGERIVETLVPQSELRSSVSGRGRGLVSGILLAALVGCGAPTEPLAPLPVASLCTGRFADTLWIDGRPYIEQLSYCPRPQPGGADESR